jgi:hypothetical protein
MKQTLTIRQVAQEYIDGQGLLDQFRGLNNARIGAKFECSIETVMKAAGHMPNYMAEEDQVLVRQLVAERNRLEREYKQRTFAALQRRYGYSTDRIRIELYCMGFLTEGAPA